MLFFVTYYLIIGSGLSGIGVNPSSKPSTALCSRLQAEATSLDLRASIKHSKRPCVIVACNVNVIVNGELRNFSMSMKSLSYIALISSSP